MHTYTARAVTCQAHAGSPCTWRSARVATATAKAVPARQVATAASTHANAPNEPASFESWLHAAQRAAEADADAQCSCLRELEDIEPLESTGDVARAVNAVVSNLSAISAAGVPQQCAVVDAIGDGLAPHPAVLQALDRERHVAPLLERAAASDAAFADGQCIVQLAAAQHKLQTRCERFWQRLEQHDIGSMQTNELAALVCYAAKCMLKHPTARASNDLWAAVHDKTQLLAVSSKSEAFVQVALAQDFAFELQERPPPPPQLNAAVEASLARTLRERELTYVACGVKEEGAIDWDDLEQVVPLREAVEHLRVHVGTDVLLSMDECVDLCLKRLERATSDPDNADSHAKVSSFVSGVLGETNEEWASLMINSMRVLPELDDLKEQAGCAAGPAALYCACKVHRALQAMHTTGLVQPLPEPQQDALALAMTNARAQVVPADARDALRWCLRGHIDNEHIVERVPMKGTIMKKLVLTAEGEHERRLQIRKFVKVIQGMSAPVTHAVMREIAQEEMFCQMYDKKRPDGRLGVLELTEKPGWPPEDPPDMELGAALFARAVQLRHELMSERALPNYPRTQAADVLWRAIAMGVPMSLEERTALEQPP